MYIINSYIYDNIINIINKNSEHSLPNYLYVQTEYSYKKYEFTDHL